MKNGGKFLGERGDAKGKSPLLDKSFMALWSVPPHFAALQPLTCQCHLGNRGKKRARGLGDERCGLEESQAYILQLELTVVGP